MKIYVNCCKRSLRPVSWRTLWRLLGIDRHSEEEYEIYRFQSFISHLFVRSMQSISSLCWRLKNLSVLHLVFTKAASSTSSSPLRVGTFQKNLPIILTNHQKESQSTKVLHRDVSYTSSYNVDKMYEWCSLAAAWSSPGRFRRFPLTSNQESNSRQKSEFGSSIWADATRRVLALGCSLNGLTMAGNSFKDPSKTSAPRMRTSINQNFSTRLSFKIKRSRARLKYLNALLWLQHQHDEYEWYISLPIRIALDGVQLGKKNIYLGLIRRFTIFFLFMIKIKRYVYCYTKGRLTVMNSTWTLPWLWAILQFTLAKGWENFILNLVMKKEYKKSWNKSMNKVKEMKDD